MSVRSNLKAFSLPEMLVVLVIIGILVLIALPNLMPLISKAKAMEAQQQLAFVHTLQKSYFYTYSRYSDSLDEIGFEQQPLVTEEGNAITAGVLSGGVYSKPKSIDWGIERLPSFRPIQ